MMARRTPFRTRSQVNAYGQSYADAARWRHISSLADAGELTAQWLEGRSTYVPSYLAPEPDQETGPLAPALARMNRAGLLTDSSQPGSRTVSGNVQRAYVTGFCDDATHTRLLTGLLTTDLVLLSYAPGEIGLGDIAVTTDGGEPFTWLARTEAPDDRWHYYAEQTSVALADVIESCWQVQVFDPVWGRNDALWPELLGVLEHRDARRA